jgi:hypothetical protein
LRRLLLLLLVAGHDCVVGYIFGHAPFGANEGPAYRLALAAVTPTTSGSARVHRFAAQEGFRVAPLRGHGDIDLPPRR